MAAATTRCSWCDADTAIFEGRCLRCDDLERQITRYPELAIKILGTLPEFARWSRRLSGVNLANAEAAFQRGQALREAARTIAYLTGELEAYKKLLEEARS